MNIENKKKSGFTLIEIMLAVGLIAILMIAIYTVYDKISNKVKAYTLSNNLITLSKGIETSFATVLDPTGLNNPYALAAQIVPNSLVGGSSTGISNSFGGGITLSSAGNNYSISIDTIPSDYCTYIATSNFFRIASGITINSAVIKTSGPMTSPHIASIAAACVSNPNATIVATLPVLTPPLDVSGDVSPIRNKEDPRYIAKISTTSPSQACSGGTWSGTFCSCPAGTEWNGSSCLAFGTTTPQPGWCPLGEGWLPNTKTCAVLPNINTANVNRYIEGKNLPDIITTERTQDTQRTDVITDADNDIVAGRSIYWQNGNLDAQTLQVCVNGTWDATTTSCVTP